MYRAVVDTNIFVSALLGSGVNRSIKSAFSDGHFICVTSGHLLSELIVVLSRPELSLDADTVTELLSLILERAAVSKHATRITDCRDPKDNMVLEAAVDGAATHIVTGDRDLLSLHPYQRSYGCGYRDQSKGRPATMNEHEWDGNAPGFTGRSDPMLID